jgi:hypothetical protein
VLAGVAGLCLRASLHASKDSGTFEFMMTNLPLSRIDASTGQKRTSKQVVFMTSRAAGCGRDQSCHYCVAIRVLNCAAIRGSNLEGDVLS